MNISELKKMSKVERIQAMEALWDSLLYEDEIETPEWHKEILMDRKKKISDGKAKFISLEDLKASRKQ
jgi:putative addiction module component (TIGR02574 family)